MKKRVLVIENDEAVRTVICTMLKRGGYEPVEAINGVDGVDAYLHARFDLVITDLFMPAQNGFDTIRQIRQLDRDVPIVAVSGLAWEPESGPLQDAMAAGANRAFGKPFQADELLSAVRELLEDYPVGFDVRELGR